MRLIGKERLSVIRNVDNDIDTWISAWVAELSNANWRSKMELLNAYPRAISLLEADSFVFPVLGNKKIGINVTFCFNGRVAVIREVVGK